MTRKKINYVEMLSDLAEHFLYLRHLVPNMNKEEKNKIKELWDKID